MLPIIPRNGTRSRFDVSSPRLRDGISLLLLLLVFVYVGIQTGRVAYDDAWITYRYAYNLASGHGFVYNLGERFLGTSAPGFTVLLAILGWPAPDAIPAISSALSALSLGAVGLGLYVFGRSFDDWLGGLVAGLLFVVNPIAIEAFGGEMLLQMALVVWAFVAESRRRWMLAVALALAATVMRPDGLVALALIGAHQVYVRRTLPWREMVVSAAVLGLFYGGLWWYFGSPLPQTLAAKNAQRVTGLWRPLGTDLVDWFRAMTTTPSLFFTSRPVPGFTSMLVLAGCGVPALLWFRHWGLLVLWPVCYLLAYRQLHLPFYHWYAVPPLLAVVVAAAAACAALGAMLVWCIDRMRQWRARAPMPLDERWLWHATLVVVVVVGLVRPMAAFSAPRGAPNPASVEMAYERLGRWFADNTPETASFGYMEIGIAGFYSHRTVIDALGLVNPDVAQHVAQRDLLWAFRKHRPDYIVVFEAVPLEPWFAAEYQYLTSLDSGRPSKLMIYRRTSTTGRVG